jgi:hypothetical protein
MNANTAARIAAAKATRGRSIMYRIDLGAEDAERAGTFEFPHGTQIVDRGAYGVAFRASDDEQARVRAARIVAQIKAGSYRLTTGLGVHKRPVAAVGARLAR